MAKKETLHGYSKIPDLVTPYEGPYPNLLEFSKPWEVAIQVGQSRAKFSLDGRPLQSEGFSKCSAAVLRNHDTGITGLVHVIAYYDHEFQLASDLEPLGEGQKGAVVYKGTVSSNEAEYMLPYLGIPIEEVVTVDTGQQHWSIMYRPQEDKVYLDQRSQKKLVVFEGFGKKQ